MMNETKLLRRKKTRLAQHRANITLDGTAKLPLLKVRPPLIISAIVDI